MNTAWNVLISPLGPAIVLIVGLIAQVSLGRRLGHPRGQRILALLFWGVAAWQVLGLRLQPVVPVFSRPWRPPFSLSGAHLLWVGDGWNWYVSFLVILLGGVAVILNGLDSYATQPASRRDLLRNSVTLASHLGVLATALLFVGSGNLLTVTLTWVAMDVFILARHALVPAVASSSVTRANYSHGLSLLGALLLLVSLLPAGSLGPGQPLQGGQLPGETVFLLVVASAIRAGAYPFHFWLLSDRPDSIRLSEFFSGYLAPALCGLWLLGWSIGLGGESMLLRPEFISLGLLALVGSALAAFTATGRGEHTAFVLITSVSLAGLVGLLSPANGPEALIWPTTAFALGGGLWLVGQRAWREWGWQIPVSVGALALVGVPFTPGFLTQPFVARLLGGQLSVGPAGLFFGVYILAQTLQVAALLRSWGGEPREPTGLHFAVVARLVTGSVMLALPLVLAGLFPQAIAALAAMPNAIPEGLGNPPSAVAGPTVWLTLGLPLLLGIVLAMVRPRLGLLQNGWSGAVSRLTGLEWLNRLWEWGTVQISRVWDNGLQIVEGAGYIGWLIAFILLGFLFLS